MGVDPDAEAAAAVAAAITMARLEQLSQEQKSNMDNPGKGGAEPTSGTGERKKEQAKAKEANQSRTKM